MPSQRIEGYTLIELLIATTIICILAQIGIGGMYSLIAKTRNNIALQTTITTLDRARSLAVTRNKRVGVCMLTAEATCSPDWTGDDLAVFVDSNKNRQRDTEEELIYRQPWPSQKIQLQWSNWRSEPLITYEPNGAVVSNGTLTLHDSDSAKSIAVVISKPGRARIEANTTD